MTLPPYIHWKEWGDSNFQICLPVPPQAPGVVGTLNCGLFISQHCQKFNLIITNIIDRVGLPLHNIHNGGEGSPTLSENGL